MTRRQALAITFGAIALGFVLAGAYYFLAPPNMRLAPYTDADYTQTAAQRAIDETARISNTRNRVSLMSAPV